MKKTDPPAASVTHAHGLRGYLYGTAAVTGGAIMIIEILGAKMLAPYVGTSHFVWTAQIAVTLVALATGYFVGGWLVDRSPRMHVLSRLILSAAVSLCLSVLVVQPVAYWCLGFRLALGSLLASAALFFLPLSLLAMVGPFAIRLLTVTVSNVGENVGRLTATSTLGSVAGTVLIGYVLIPLCRNSVTMLLTAGLLAAVALAGLVFCRKQDRQTFSLLAGLLVGLLLAAAALRRDQVAQVEGQVELSRQNSNFGLLQVIEMSGGTRRYLLNDYLTQNSWDPQANQSVSMFTYMLHELARAYSPETRQVLCIGLGVGVVPMQFANDGARVDVVEINPTVVPLAARFFGCQPERLRLTIGDGRQYLTESRDRYDAIILDAFLGDSSPSHLMTEEAFTAMRQRLRPEGVLVINSFCDFDPGRDFFGASLDKTLKEVFQSVRIHAAGNGNVFFVASPKADLRVLHPPELAQVHPACRYLVEEAFRGTLRADPNSGIVLTDDYNPVEFYDASAREALRRRLALDMKPL